MQLLAASAATNSYAIENLACHSQAILSSVLAPTHSVTVSKVATDHIQPHDHPSFAVADVLPVGRPMIKPDKHAAIWAMQPDRLRRSELAPRGCDPITMSDRVSGSAACVTLRAICVLHTHEQQHFCWLRWRLRLLGCVPLHAGSLSHILQIDLQVAIFVSAPTTHPWLAGTRSTLVFKGTRITIVHLSVAICPCRRS